MPFPVTQAITEAYYVSGIVARQFESVDGQQITDGLSLLNRILDAQGITGRPIPYYQTYTFNATIGQELYFIENLIEIDVETFNIGSTRFPTREVGRKRYFGTPRPNNVNSLPYTWNLERTTNGANLRMYPKPADTYPINFIGKFALSVVTLNTDLQTLYDLYYIDYLIYVLARRICADNNEQFSPENEQTLAVYEQKINDISPLDLTMKKISTLQRRTGYSYADINFGRGWVPMI